VRDESLQNSLSSKFKPLHCFKRLNGTEVELQHSGGEACFKILPHLLDRPAIIIKTNFIVLHRDSHTGGHHAPCRNGDYPWHVLAPEL
jgi:hypothetical protein